MDDGRNGRLSGPEKFSGTLRELLADGNAIDVNRKMRDLFFSDMGSCSKVTYSAWIKRPLPQRFMESTIRLFSPIL